MKKILSPMEKIRFPESEELPEGVKEIDVKDTFGYCTELYPDVEYAEHSGRKLHLQIMTPLVYGKDLKWPLIVYVQGSSWHKQKLFQSLPTLVRMCERGYAVAIVEHRESELAPFPAQVIDTKAAIRFLRMNVETIYRIDTHCQNLFRIFFHATGRSSQHSHIHIFQFLYIFHHSVCFQLGRLVFRTATTDDTCNLKIGSSFQSLHYILTNVTVSNHGRSYFFHLLLGLVYYYLLIRCKNKHFASFFCSLRPNNLKIFLPNL